MCHKNEHTLIKSNCKTNIWCNFCPYLSKQEKKRSAYVKHAMSSLLFTDTSKHTEKKDGCKLQLVVLSDLSVSKSQIRLNRF